MQKVFKNMLKLFVVVFPFLVNATANGQPNLSGVWKTVRASLDDPNWRIIDLACVFCPVAQYDYLEALLSDPANDDKPTAELLEQSREYFADYLADQLTPEAKRQQEAYDPASDPALDCDPEDDGLYHQILAPVPIEIEQSADKVIIRYEYWNAVRTIYMDGRGPPTDAEPSRLGHSIGRYEGSDLVVETVNMVPAVDFLPGGTVTGSRDAIFTERFTPSDDGKRLDFEVTIVDPAHFREPHRARKSYLLAPGWELDEFVCEAITGEF